MQERRPCALLECIARRGTRDSFRYEGHVMLGYGSKRLGKVVVGKTQLALARVTHSVRRGMQRHAEMAYQQTHQDGKAKMFTRWRHAKY